MGKIAIVSDSSTILNSVQAKLVLLREDDTVLKCACSDAFRIVHAADIIIYHVSRVDDIALTTITNIKKSNNFILLLAEEVEPKSILAAYDAGANDFCTIDVTNFELLIKIINAKKALKQRKTLERLKTLLRDRGCMKPASDIYTRLGDIVDMGFHAELINSTMLAISVEENSRQEFLLNGAEALFPKLLRESDFIINYADFKYLIILPDTAPENARKIFDKLAGTYNLNAVAFSYKSENSQELLSRIERLETLRNANDSYYFFDETQNTVAEPENDWLSNELTEEEPPKYKLFQNIFAKKLETVIKPAFYRVKQKYEKSFPNTKFKYFTDKDCAEFLLINFDKTNSLQISCPNRAKININMKYSGLDAPENQNLNLPFSKLNTRTMCEILEEFVTNFKYKGEN